MKNDKNNKKAQNKKIKQESTINNTIIKKTMLFNVCQRKRIK